MVFGPVNQRDFLLRMGIEHRMEKLKAVVDGKERDGLDLVYRMMTDADQMGSRFKFLSIVPGTLEKILNKYPLVGFH